MDGDLARRPEPARGRPVTVLLAAGSAVWEAQAVARLSEAGTGVHLVQRCLDLADLLGAAATGTAEVAVLADQVTGLDADSVARLHRTGLRVLVVSDHRPADSRTRPDAAALRRLEVDLVMDADDLASLAARVRDLARAVGPRDGPSWPDSVEDLDDEDVDLDDGRRTGRLLAVWGAAGAPGRTSTAVGLAAEAAHRGHATLLVDADLYGGTVAQRLAILDEVSGLLGAARLANGGQLDRGRLAGLARTVDPGLRVLTGLPRPGRWTEVRPTAFDEVLAVARLLDELVVVDTGPGIDAGADDPFDTTPSRDECTRTVLREADAVVLVASPDPIGLQRAARAVVDLAELRPDGADVVAVNRMRASLGWDRRDIAGLFEQVAPGARPVFLPDDLQAADRALVSGQTLVVSGDSPLRRAVADLAGEVLTLMGLDSAPSARRRRTRSLRRPGRTG